MNQLTPTNISKKDLENYKPDLENLQPVIDDATLSLVGFTHGITKLFTSGDASSNKQFKNLRNLVVEDALLYFQVVGPITQQVFTNLYNIFDDFENLDSEEEMLENIKEFIEQSTQLNEKLIICQELHEESLNTANNRSMTADRLMEKLKISRKDFDEKAQEAKKNYQEQQGKMQNSHFPNWVWIFPPIWVIQAIETIKNYHFEKKAQQFETDHIVYLSSSEMFSQAILSISEIVVPALQQYISNLSIVISILSAFSLQLNQIRRGTVTEVTNNSFFFKKVKKNVPKIKQASNQMISYFTICKAKFNSLESFMDKGTYLDEWLIENSEKYSLVQRIKAKLFASEIKPLFDEKQMKAIKENLKTQEDREKEQRKNQ